MIEQSEQFFFSTYKNIVLIFSLIKRDCFDFFSIYKMVHSKYSTDKDKSSKNSIGEIMKNSELLCST